MAADRVVMPRNTCMMIHNAAWATYGNPTELRKSADDLEIINTAAISSYTARAGDKLPESELRQMLDAETWLSADDCIKYGLADEYGDTDADTLEGVYFRLLREAMEQSPENREEILLAAELSRKILEGRDIAL